MAASQWLQPSMTDPSLLQLQEGWGYVLWCIPAAALFYGLALWLYRKRKLESAGDIMAFRPLRPVFLVLFTFSAGAALHLFSQLFMGEQSMMFLVVGLCVGFYACLMLLSRTVRVFRLRTLAQLGVILGVFGLTLLVTVLDPLGLTKWVPEQKEVESVSLSPYYMDLNGPELSQTIEDPETIEKILSLHQYAVEHRTENGAVVDFYLTYQLKNGRVAIRHYYLDTDSPVTSTLKQVLSRPECVFGGRYTTPEKLLAEVEEILIYPHDSKEELRIEDPLAVWQIVEALYADSAEGTLCQHWALMEDQENTHNIHIGGVYTGWYLSVGPECKNTYALLEVYIDTQGTEIPAGNSE
jgi:hypothetical protein